MTAAQPLCASESHELPPLGTKVRFRASEAPRAFRLWGSQVGTIVTRNHADQEVGITFGWSGKRTDEAWRWSGADPLHWAKVTELVVMP